MRFRLPHALVLCALLAAAPLLRAADAVERTPPPVYREQLAALLTPLDAVLAGRTAFPEDKTGGVVLLAESFRYRTADGTEYRLAHSISYAVSQAGVEPLGDDTFTYDRERESIFLIDAATILPDGTRLPVEDKGAFIQTPQHEAENALYTSQAELHLVYPQIAPGAMTEAVVLVRENVPVMPGQFAAARTFGSGWPTYRHRFVVDLPDADWARVSFAGSSPAVPEPVSERSGPDRERRIWARDRITATPWEYYAPDYAFRAPTLWMTTLRSWDDLAVWYREAVAKASTLGPELAAAVDQATAKLSDRAAIIEALHRLASEEVRYTGLEFGLAGYQPHACAEVWQKRYGDCKDKATLLRAMLARKGIPAHLVLLDTRGGGRIERASPSWRQFNHAILAVEDGRGGLLFCDPTAKHLPSGTVGINDLARDVLVLRDDHAEWVVQPDLLDAGIRISAELVFSPEGELSGWFDYHTTGTDAAYYAEYFNGLDRQDLRKSLQDYVEAFFGGAEVVDVDYTPAHGAITDLHCRAFFVRPARNHTEASLAFPYPANWLPTVANEGGRRFPYFTSRRDNTVDITLALPPGWKTTAQPEDFSAPSPVATIEASWKRTGDRVTAHLLHRPERAEIAPADFATFQRSIRALQAWMERPATFALNAAEALADSPATAGTLDNFPVLPTADGQFRLLEERFPADSGKDARRRLALGKILQWFPQDTEAVFQAKVHLLQLDEAKLGDRAFADEIAKLLRQHGRQLSSSLRSWGEYLEANSRWLATKNPKSLAKLQDLARDESLNPFRRGWAAHAAGLALLTDKKPHDAAAFLAAFTDFDCEARPQILSLTARAYARAGETKPLQKWLGRLVAAKPADLDPLLARMLGALTEDRPAIPAEHLPKIAAAFAATLARAGDCPTATPALEKLRGSLASEEAQRQVTTKLAAWLQAHPPQWWTKTRLPAYKTAAALAARIDEENKKPDVPLICDLILQLLLQHQPDYPAFAKYSDWLVWYLNNRKIEQPLLDYASELLLVLPPGSSEDTVDAWLIRAAFLRRADRPDEARALYGRICDHPAIQDYQKVEAGGELGLLELGAGQPEAALAAWRRLEPIHTRHKHGIDYLYPELCVLLDRGEYDRALEVVARIKEQDTKYLDAAYNATALQYLLRTADRPEALKHYWRQAALAQPAWDRLLAAEHIAPAGLPDRVDFSATLAKADKARAANDRTTYLAQLDVFMRVARVIPYEAFDLAYAGNTASDFSNDLQQQFYTAILPLFTDLEPLEPAFDAKAGVWETVILNNTGHKAEAATKAAALYRALGPTNPLGTNALRIWAIAVRKTPEEARVLAILRGLFGGPLEVADRLDLLRVYSDSLQLRGDRTENILLLQRETTRADFKADNGTAKTLLARLAQLRQEGAAAEALGNYVRTWLAAPAHAWLEHLQPTALDTPRFSGRREPMANAESGFSDSERLKFNLLLALDPLLDLAKRETAFCDVLWQVAIATNDIETLTGDILAAADSEALSADNRAYLLRLAAWQIAHHGRADLLARCTAHPQFTNQNAAYREMLTAATQALAQLAASDDPARLGAAFQCLTARPVDPLSADLANELLQYAALTGHADEADALVAATEKLAIAPYFDKSPAALRLMWTRSARWGRELAPFVATLRTAARTLPGADTPLTPRAQNLIDGTANAALTIAEQLALSVARLEHPQRGLRALEEAIDLLRWPLITSSQQRTVAFAPIEAITTLPMADGLRASLLLRTINLADGDDPAARTQIEKCLAPLLTPAAAEEQPQSAAGARLLLAGFALRTSQDPHPEILFDPQQTKLIPPQWLRILQLQFFATRGQRGALEAAFETADPTLIAEFGILDSLEPVLRTPSHAAERKLFEQAADEIFTRKLNEAWLNVHSRSFWYAVIKAPISAAANRQALDAWLEHAAIVTRSEGNAAELRLRRARLADNYPDIKSAADDLLRLAPTMYDIYYDRARAEAALGDRAAAKADYDLFLQHCRDSAYYQTALAARQALDAQP